MYFKTAIGCCLIVAAETSGAIGLDAQLRCHLEL